MIIQAGYFTTWNFSDHRNKQQLKLTAAAAPVSAGTSNVLLTTMIRLRFYAE